MTDSQAPFFYFLLNWFVAQSQLLEWKVHQAGSCNRFSIYLLSLEIIVGMSSKGLPTLVPQVKLATLLKNST